MSKTPCINRCFDAMVVVVCGACARSGYYELFVDVPRVHEARWPLSWAMPGVALAIMCLATIVGIATAIYRVARGRRAANPRAIWLTELTALIVTVIAWVAWQLDFLTRAGGFG